MQKELLNTKEAAYYLGVSPNHLRLSRHKGELFKGVQSPPFISFNSAIRYRYVELEKWIRTEGKRSNSHAHTRILQY